MKYLNKISTLAFVLSISHSFNSQASPGVTCDIENCKISIHSTLSIASSIDGFSDLGNRYQMIGDLVITTPAGSVKLLDADLVFDRNPEGSNINFEVYGVAQAPLGSIPLLGNGALKAQPVAAVGLVSRATLKSILESEDYSVPLSENPIDPKGDPNKLKDPAYLFFHFDTGLSIDIPLNEMLGINDDNGSGFGFSVPGDRSVSLVFDPLEPYFYITSEASMNLNEVMQQAVERANESNDQKQNDNKQQNDKDPSDALPLPELKELAFSLEGGIPFEPDTLWGLPSDVGLFKGHLMFNAAFPLSPFVELEGEIVTSINQQGYIQGGNGDVSVNIDLIPGLLNFSFALGNASAGVTVIKEQQVAYFSGIQSPDTSFLPAWVPIVPANETLISGYINSQHLELTRLNARGQFGYSPQGLSDLLGISLNDLAMSQAEMSITIDGIKLKGKTGSSIHPSIELGTEADVEIFFPFRYPAEASIKMSGEMLVLGTGLSPVSLEISKRGFYINGQFVTPLSTIAMTGQITNKGPLLQGAASIKFPIDDITRKLNSAQHDVAKARAEVDRLQRLVDQQSNIVLDERKKHAKALQTARNALTIAQNYVKRLQSSINYQYKTISNFRKHISSKYRWYKRQPWYKKSWAWAKYTAYKAYKYGQIGVAYSKIGGLNVAKKAAILALEGAKKVLLGLEKGTAIIPVEADPRVFGLIASKNIAKGVLVAAEEVLKRIPVVDVNFGGDIIMTLSIMGVSGEVSAYFNNVDLLTGKVSFDPIPKACVTVPVVGQVCTPF